MLFPRPGLPGRGEVAERLNAPDSKSGSAVSVDGGSNPPLSVATRKTPPAARRGASFFAARAVLLGRQAPNPQTDQVGRFDVSGVFIAARSAAVKVSNLSS